MARTGVELTSEEILTVGDLNDLPNNTMIYKDNSGNYQSFPLGTIGQVITSNGASSAPSFQDPGGGGGGGITESFRSWMSTTQGITTSIVKIDFDMETYDQNGNFDTANQQYIVPSDGKYQFSYMISMFGFTDQDLVQIFIYKDSSIVHSNSNRSSGGNLTMTATDSFDLLTGEIIQIRIRNLNGNRGSINQTENDSMFSGFKLY